MYRSEKTIKTRMRNMALLMSAAIASSVNLYALYTIREDGKLDLLGKDIPNCSSGQFSVVFEMGENGSFFGSMWDNAVGERITIKYIWDEAQKTYVESESPDTVL